MPLRLLPVVVLLAGCGKVTRYDTAGWYDEPVADEETTLSSTSASFSVDSVWPAFGSDAGGSEVRIQGGPFDRSAAVRVGGAPATVLEWSDDELLVETPPGQAGTAVVQVFSDDGEATHSFRYWEDATGLVGMKGSFEFIDVVGDYWVDDGSDRARAEILLVEPVEYEAWEAFSPTFNSCASDWALPRDVPVDGMDDVVLVSADVQVDLQADDLGWTGDEGVAPGESYGIEPSGAWDGVVLDDLAVVPVGLRVLSPSLDGNVPKKVDRQFEVTWDQQSPADFVAIVLEKAHFESNGSVTVDQKVTCAVPDAGAFTVPGSMWADWQEDDLVLISVGRVFEGEGVQLPHNNASTAVSGIYWVAGAVRAR